MNHRIVSLFGRRQLVGWGLVGALLVQLVALYLPGSPEPSSFPIPEADKAVHFLLFAVPTFLAALLPGRALLVSLIVIHAPLSELIQLEFVPFRSGDWVDLLADLIGITVGYLFGRGVSRAATPALAES